ncbi:MAG: hypothetical protein MUC63_02410, partial [Planctomycetes bacterium]|nr:hypothetical protein [Planctomycetota bacterium]
MERTYLALGDSMSIDEYTGIPQGGAVSQFKAFLGTGWRLASHAFDGCTIRQVPRHHSGDVITLTIGGNDLLQDSERWLADGLGDFEEAHLGDKIT